MCVGEINFFFVFRRTTYIIGKDGEIKYVFESFFSYNYHISNVLKALRKDATAEDEVEAAPADAPAPISVEA